MLKWNMSRSPERHYQACKMDPAAVSVLQALLALLTFPVVASAPCPRLCSCPQPTELHCTFRSLITIPAAVSKHVKRMNLGFNSIDKITATSLAGLRELELFLVHGNNIHSLPNGVFRDLNSLQMLKMSYNKLREINRHTLQGLWALGRLHLDHNQLEFIHPDAFQGLTSLRLLQLEGNQLQQLHPATFATFTLMGYFHVSTLRHLYLSDNGLMSMSSELVATMPQLENLYLHGNPWTCDCNMRWLHEWDKNSPGVLKCKKDRALPGGQLCPMCSSPKQLQGVELQNAKNLVCSGPVISSPYRTSASDDVESEVMTVKDFRDPFGNVSLGLSDEHGNEVELECSIDQPREFNKIGWEEIGQLQLAVNISLSVDMECPVDREKYERLWRLIAYYSNVPAHLQRGVMLSKEPNPAYVYRQDSEKDALYYTGVRVNVMAQPAWLMQAAADLQLNRLHSSAKTVNLILSTDLSEMVEVELARSQRRTWVMIESTNTTRKVLSAILGSTSQMNCGVHSSGQPVIQWMLPDGSKVEAPYISPDNRVSVSSEGRLVITAVRHTDVGIYYCLAKVHGDLAVLPFHLTVQESSSPPPGEDASLAPIEEFAGNPVSLPCNTSGSPDPEIIWILPSSDIVHFQANSSRAVVFSNGTLHIPQTQLSDSGHYKCIAINQHGVDTLAAKITLTRRRGVVRPLRKFPARPLPASGVNSHFKIPTEDAVEASGDIEVTQIRTPIRHFDASRRRIPGGVATGRRGFHPSRNMRRRPQVPLKPTSSQVEDGNNIVDNRRRINMSKSKIDPEKWADILAKIRNRNAQSTTVTPLAVQDTTEWMMPDGTTLSEPTIEGSSGGVTVQHYIPTPVTPTQHKQTNADKQDVQSHGVYVTSKNFDAYQTHDTTSNSPKTHSIHVTTELQTTQTSYDVQHITLDTNLDAHTTSNSVFFLPLSTSGPPNAVTFWQGNTNTASSSAFSLPENHSRKTDADGVTTADWGRVLERSGSHGGRFIPSVGPNEAETNAEINGDYLSETPTPLQQHTQPQDTTPSTLHSKILLTQPAFPTITIVPTSTKSRVPPQYLHQSNSKRKNGGGRRKSNRRRQKLNKHTHLIATPPTNASLATVRTLSPSQLKTEITTASLSNTVPFSSSQAPSSGTQSYEESTVSGHGANAATKLSLAASPHETSDSILPLAKPLLKSTSVAPTFPIATPGMGHGKMSSQTGTPSVTLQTFMETPSQPVKPSQEMEQVSVTGYYGLAPHSDSSSLDIPTPTQAQTDFRMNQSGYQHTPTEEIDKVFFKENDAPPLPSSPTSVGLLMEHNTKTTSGAKATSSSLFEKDLGTELVSTKTLTLPRTLYHRPSQNKTTTSESAENKHVEDAPNIRINADAVVTSPEIPSAASLMPDAVTPISVAAYVRLPETTSTEANMGPTLMATSPPYSNTFNPATQINDHKLTPVATLRPTSPAVKLVSIPTIKQVATPAPTRAAKQKTDGFREGKQQAPGQGSTPRGTPRIHKSNFQIFTVKAETDVQLPCEAKGETIPSLSWTKVSSGLSIAPNTRIQRFEVLPNGTLIIRNTQPTDGGQYLCTVQNQYGTDTMLVNLVILSQQPRVLLPQRGDITVQFGGKVHLDCIVEGHPTPRVKWVLPNHVHMAAPLFDASPQQRVSVLSNGTLHISQATDTDRGIYKCIGSSAAGADSASIHLNVSVLLPVIQQTQNESTTLPEGSNAYIHCSATGAPPPVIRWITPDGVQLIASQVVAGHNLFVFPNGTLHIKGLGQKNAGRYECQASNIVASSKRTVFVNVRRNLLFAKASITYSSPQKTDVIYGGKLLLNCVAKGEPEPWILWRTPSKKLVDAQYSFDPRIKVLPNGTITIHSVTDKDSGDYLCVARNKMGDDYILLHVNVLTRPAKIKQKQQQSRQEVIYGGDLKVDCVASGLPYPEISWALPDGTMVNPTKERASLSRGRSRRYVVFDNGTLYFSDVGMPEEGDYTCYAENQLGKDEMKVRVKVKVATSPPQILDKDQKIIRVAYGETVTLRCNTKGESTPVITWISPTNRVISPALDKYQVLNDGILVVQKVQLIDSGNYTCIARNNAGQDHKVIGLDVLVTPPVINGLSGTTNINLRAVQDQRTFVDCVAKGTPTPRVMWVLPGNVILPAPYYSNRMTVHPNGTLELWSPKRTDSGQLTCIARNEGGEVKLVVNLDVQGIVRPQSRGSKTENLSLTVGTVMTLNCSSEGLKLPHVSWILPNGTPLNRGARFSKFFHRQDGSLIITNPSVAEAGMYRCMGRNFQGFVEHTITLSPGRKPEIINRYNSPVSAMIGDYLLLHCITNGKPLRHTWTLPSGVLLNRLQRAGRYAVLANGTLAIQQLSIYDRGSYVCRVSNEYGSSQLSVSVNVIAYPPQITNGPPSVTYAKHGVAIQLNCIATGTPLVEIAWETPDKTRLTASTQPRLFGNKYLHPKGALIIQNPTQRDSGVYRCTARNTIGVDSKVTFLNVF